MYYDINVCKFACHYHRYKSELKFPFKSYIFSESDLRQSKELTIKCKMY